MEEKKREQKNEDSWNDDVVGTFNKAIDSYSSVSSEQLLQFFETLDPDSKEKKED